MNELSTRIISIIFISFLAYGLYAILPTILRIKKINFQKLLNNFSQDLETIEELSKKATKLIKKINTYNNPNFQTGELIIKNRPVIKKIWQEIVSIIFEIDTIKKRYRQFLSFQNLTEKSKYDLAFLLSFYALLTQHKLFIKISKATKNNTKLEQTLNQKDEDDVIPKNSLERILTQMTDADESIKIAAGELYFHTIKTSKDPIINQLQTIITTNLESISQNFWEYSNIGLKKPFKLIKKIVNETVFPIKKQIMIGGSIIEVPFRKKLINKKVINSKILSKLKPGDIILTRKEWQLSNLGIPGYWTHALLYTGKLEELSLDTQKIIQDKSPLIAKQMAKKSILESTSKGVHLSKLTKALKSDSLVILRTKLNQEELESVILEALKHYGKPYDYELDFIHNHSLICSELIYKSFLTSKKINLEIPNYNWNYYMMVPNNLAEKFAQEINNPNQELDLILYLEGNTIKNKLTQKSAKAFCESAFYSKWHKINLLFGS
jgi:hypothetical protein